MDRRVVITGLGTVTAVGVGTERLWDAMCSVDPGATGLRPIQRFDASGFASPLGGEARDGDGPFTARDYLPKHYRKAVKVMAKDVELAVASAKLAADDAGLVTRGTQAEGEAATTYPSERMACHIGDAGFIAAETEELTMAMASSVEDGTFSLRRWGNQDGGTAGMNNLQPLWMLKYLPNMLACHVTIVHGLEGPSNTLLNGEASGLLSLGESLRVVQRGAADLGFAGSAESKLNPMGLLRMELSGRIAPMGAGAMTPREVVRPFSQATLGGLIGEAGGIVIVEDEQVARARGARVHARVLGFGAAHSLVAPLPDKVASGETPDEAAKGSGRGLAHAMRSAIRDAGLEPGQIDAVVPEGSGVAFVDRAEAWALRAVFGARAEAMPLVCVSPIVGGCAAGNGGVQAVVGAMLLSRGKLPEGVTVTLDGRSWEKDSGSGISTGKLRRILLCSMGLSGQNAAIVLEAV